MSDDFNINEIRPIIENMMPLDVIARYDEEASVSPITWSRLFIQGPGGRALATCSRCAALVRDETEHRKVHETWHENISLAIWLLQGFVVHHIASHEGILPDDD